MKQRLLQKTLLLLFALIAGSTSAWAAKETITLSAQGYTNGQAVTSTSGTVVTLTYEQGTSTNSPAYYDTGNGVRVYYGGRMVVTASGKTITKVIVTFGKDKSPTISMTSNGTTTSGGTESPATWVGSATEVYFNVSNKGHARIQSVEVTYDAPKTGPTITFNDGTAFIGKTLNLNSLFSSNSDGDVTYSITAGGSFATLAGSILTGVAAGEVTVKAEQAAAGDYNAGEATATITVTPYVQPMEVTFNINQAMFDGVTFNSSNQTTEASISATVYEVEMTIGEGDSNTYVKDGEFRCYKNGSLTFDAPSGYFIAQIVFTKGSNWAMNSVNTGTLSGQKWTATDNTGTVTFGFSGRTDITKVVVTLGVPTTLTLASACTDGTMFYGTYSNSKAFVVPSDLIVSEVTVIDGELSVEDYATGDIVPANTGVMVSSDTYGDHTVLLTIGGTSVLGDDNMLKPSGDAGISAANMTAADTKFYRLTMHNGTQIGFWYGAAGGAAFDLAANKAYLAVPNSAMTREGFWFDDTTGIQSIDNGQLIKDNVIYDLSGRRVENPTKGIYIMNGKKFVVK